MAARHDEGVGAAIRRQRESLGLSQRTLAKRAGVSQPYLSQLEAATRCRVSVGILRRVAEALGVPTAHFVDGEPPGLPRRGRTEVWLYRIAERSDGTGQHPREVREGRLLPRRWDMAGATIYRCGGRLPHPGDVIVLCRVAGGADAAGVWGLGVITEFSDARQLRFRALPPTETLQAAPRWGPKVRRLLEDGPSTGSDALWRIREAKQLAILMGEISEELAGGWLREWARSDPPATPM
jgi:transcriptional regulator with XRE-family HTH domain